MTDTNVRLCNAGETIFAEGELGSAMYVLLAGRVGVSTARAGQVAVLGAGEFFGEMAVIDTFPRSATVTALENGTRVLPIDQHRFVYLVSQQPAFALSVMAVISRRMRSMASTGTVRDGCARGGGRRERRQRLRDRGNHAGPMATALGRARRQRLPNRRTQTIKVLVNTGLRTSLSVIGGRAQDDRRPPETVDLVVLTHEHADHLGGTALLPRGPVVAARQLTANKLALGDEFAMVSGVIGEKVAPFAVDICLPEGSVIDAEPYRFEVLHTPGHAFELHLPGGPGAGRADCRRHVHGGRRHGRYLRVGQHQRLCLIDGAAPAIGVAPGSPGARPGAPGRERPTLRWRWLAQKCCCAIRASCFQAISGEVAFDRIIEFRARPESLTTFLSPITGESMPTCGG